jgi:divalent metal cation (Fe/Co/Zn/Cd) transporter
MSQHNVESVGSVVTGFCLAVGNHTFGWFKTILQIDGSQLNDYLQALITGGIGALGAFAVNRGLKYVEKKIKSKKNEKSN